MVIPRSRNSCSSRARSCRGCSKRLGSVSIPMTSANSSSATSYAISRASTTGTASGSVGGRRVLVELTAAAPQRIERAAPGRAQRDGPALSDGGVEKLGVHRHRRLQWAGRPCPWAGLGSSCARGHQLRLTTSRARCCDGSNPTSPRSRKSPSGRRSTPCVVPPTGPLLLATPFPSPLVGVATSMRLARQRAAGPEVPTWAEGSPDRRTTPELENGDRGGWPPFSKHRCLGRGGCPSHSGCAPGVRVEPKVMD